MKTLCVVSSMDSDSAADKNKCDLWLLNNFGIVWAFLVLWCAKYVFTQPLHYE